MVWFSSPPRSLRGLVAALMMAVEEKATPGLVWSEDELKFLKNRTIELNHLEGLEEDNLAVWKLFRGAGESSDPG